MSLRVVGVPRACGAPAFPGLGPGRLGRRSGPECLARDAVLPQPPRPPGERAEAGEAGSLLLELRQVRGELDDQ